MVDGDVCWSVRRSVLMIRSMRARTHSHCVSGWWRAVDTWARSVNVPMSSGASFWDELTLCRVRTRVQLASRTRVPSVRTSPAVTLVPKSVDGAYIYKDHQEGKCVSSDGKCVIPLDMTN